MTGRTHDGGPEKIDMLEFAGVVAINKFGRRGGINVPRNVSLPLIRNRQASTSSRPDFRSRVDVLLAKNFRTFGVSCRRV